MSETLCTLRTKGGGGGAKYTETVLWTNPSPNVAFAAQTVTLSDSLSNYKYIGIRFKVHRTHASTPNATGIMLVSEFMQNRKNTGEDRRNILVASQNTSNLTMTRNAWYVSDTSVEFSAAYQLSSTNTNTDYTIPLEILGLNELAHGTVQTATGTFTNTAGTDITVNCGFRPKKVSIYNMADANTICAYIYDSNMSTTYTIVAYRTSSSSYGCSRYTIGQSINGAFQSISDTGFTFRGIGVNVSALYYVAIGESY